MPLAMHPCITSWRTPVTAMPVKHCTGALHKLSPELLAQAGSQSLPMPAMLAPFTTTNAMQPFTIADIFTSLDRDGLAATVELYELAQHTEILQQVMTTQDEIDAAEDRHRQLSEQLGELEGQLAAAGVGQ